MIQRPIARWNHKSDPLIMVYPNDRKEGMIARYQTAGGKPPLPAGLGSTSDAVESPLFIAPAASGQLGCLRQSAVRGTKTQGPVQPAGQLRQVAALDQVGNDAGQFLIDVVLVYRALQVLLAAAAAGSDPCPNHASHHLEVTITKVTELLIDLDESVEQREGKTK